MEQQLREILDQISTSSTVVTSQTSPKTTDAGQSWCRESHVEPS
jgi:hypothetical protein